MDGQLAAVDVLLGDGLSEQPLGELLALLGRDHPAHGVAGVDVDD
jgi:hypothetical protein